MVNVNILSLVFIYLFNNFYSGLTYYHVDF